MENNLQSENPSLNQQDEERNLSLKEIDYAEARELLTDAIIEALYVYLEVKAWAELELITISNFSKLDIPTVELMELVYLKFYERNSKKLISEVQVTTPSAESAPTDEQS